VTYRRDSSVGRPSILPEKLLLAHLPQVLYTVPSEPQLKKEQLDYNVLFQWFVSLNMDEAARDPTTSRHTSGDFLVDEDRFGKARFAPSSVRPPVLNSRFEASVYTRVEPPKHLSEMFG
jgi:hypothetical protein